MPSLLQATLISKGSTMHRQHLRLKASALSRCAPTLINAGEDERIDLDSRKDNYVLYQE